MYLLYNVFLCRALAGRTIFITGASRGIGKAIAIKAARDGANIVIAAKTAEPHPKLPGTIYTAAKEGIGKTIVHTLSSDFCQATSMFGSGVANPSARSLHLVLGLLCQTT